LLVASTRGSFWHEADLTPMSDVEGISGPS
jgi:hypothetical protein